MRHTHRVKRKSAHEADQPGRAHKPRLWIRLLAAVLSPVLFLGSAELVLRLVGYGYPGGFFIRWHALGRTFSLTNQHYGEHFVPRELSRTPEPCALVPKGAATIRIFVLGSSAAYGDPEPAYGFCRQLELLLNEHATDKSFEVVNAAMTAMNSHVARRIARDCVARKPDLFIVFIGNNEVVGPYGPPTLPGSLYASRGFINTCITAKKQTRVGQLLKNLGQAVCTRGTTARKWQGMESFLTHRMVADDPKLQDCYRHFRANLRDIVRTAERCGAGVILCTVPTNIRSCAPFGSQHRPDLTTDELAQWNRCFQEGRTRERAGDCAGALSAYEEARQIDDAYADLAFCTGRCLEALGKTEDAKRLFRAARDQDVLRFRADSSILRVIREVAETQPRASVLDLETLLEDQSQDRMLGSELLVDHVHLNFRGNFLAALAALQKIREMMPQAGLAGPRASEDELLGLCRQRLLYDDHERYRLAMVMYRRKTLPPFTGQIDHEAEMEKLCDELVQLRRIEQSEEEPETMYVDACQRRPLDTYLLLRHGRFLVDAGRMRDALNLYRRALDARPFDGQIRTALAQVLAQGTSKDDAVAVLTSKQAPDPYRYRDALLLLGAHCVSVGNIAQASLIYQELGRIDGRNPDVLVNQAAAASARNDLGAMKQYLDQVLARDPHSVPALTNMGNYYAKQNLAREAQPWFAQAVQADPQDPFAQIGLGIQSVRLEQMDKAIEHLARAAMLKPDMVEAHLVLAALYEQQGKRDEAKKQAELAALFRPAQR